MSQTEGGFLASSLAKPTLSKREFWDLLDKVMYYLENRAPVEIRMEMAGARKYAEQRRYLQKNKYGQGMAGDVSIRHWAAIPTRVMLAVKRASMQLKELPMTEDEFYRGFAKRYEKYRVAEEL